MRGFLNATSLYKHILMFRQYLTTARPFYHLFGVAESRFGQAVDSVFTQIDGYSVLRQDKNRHGGGVALYIHNSYKATLLCSSATETEYLMCRVQQGLMPPVFVAVVYRPPGIDSLTDDCDFIVNLRKHAVDYDCRIVMGDLYVNMLLTSRDSDFIKDFASELNLKLVDHGATHHTGNSHTWIDVILTDDNNAVLKSNNLLATSPSKHNVIDVEINFELIKPVTLNSFTYRDFKSITPETLLPLLESCDWSPINCSYSGVDSQLQHLSHNIMKVVDELDPLKQFRPRKGYP